MKIVDKTLNSIFEIVHSLSDVDGIAWTPDTSVVINIYPANSDTQIITDAAMTVKDSHTGVYKYPWILAGIAPGTYKYVIIATDSGNEYKMEDTVKVSENLVTGIDREINSTIQATAVWNNGSGIAAAPGTSIDIDIYKAGSDNKVVNAQAMSVKDSETGYYKYAWDISAVSDGAYNIVIKAVDSGNTNYKTETLFLKKGRSTPSLNGDIRIFDTNLIESATTTDEPDLSDFGAATDIRQNFMDNRAETKVTLKPRFDDSGKVDKDIEDSADWTVLNASCAISDEGTIKVVGAKSMHVDDLADTDTAEIEQTYGAVFDITDEQIGWLAVYFDDTAPDSVTLIIEDDSNETVSVTMTTDYLGNAFIIDTWQYIAFDLSGDGTIDYERIETVTFNIANTTGGEIDNIYLDGLRFIPHFYTFEYTWSANETVNLVEIKGCNSKEYDIDYYDGSYNNWADGSFTSAVDYAIIHDATGKTGTKVRIKLHVADFDGNFEIELEDLLILKHLGQGGFVEDGNIKPLLLNRINQTDNWLGPNIVFKPKTLFKCDIEFVGFPATEKEGQDDSEFVKTLFNRTRPFYIWLNGDRAENTFSILSEVWEQKNLYLVHDISKSKQGHQGENDLTNGGESYTVEFIEAAFIEEAT